MQRPTQEPPMAPATVAAPTPQQQPMSHSSPPSQPQAPLAAKRGSGPAAPTSSKNMAASRKVSKLLDITINNALRDLVVYVDDAVPDFLDRSSADGAGLLPALATAAAATTGARNSPGRAVKTSTPLQQPVSASSTHAGVPSASTTTAAGLRTALEGRVTDMHRDFLSQFKVLYDSFRDVSRHVQDLNKECSAMEHVLGMSRHGQGSTTTENGRMGSDECSENKAGALSSFAETEVLVRRVHGLQRELQNAQRRQQDIKSFKEKYNFGAAEQKVLDEGQVDTHYLDVLEQARAVHRQSRSLLLSLEYQQSAAAVVESTYTAIMHATEKISRFLLAISSSSSYGGGSGDMYRGGRIMADSAGMMSSVSADVPEVSSLFLRCATVLREENVSQWEKVIEELARARRASVLRRYFHLLTTGSATTSAGTYRAGGTAQSDVTAAGASGTSSQRPLEAELNNPVFFFSSLFAWLHQSIVEEDDFLNLFFRPAGSSTMALATSPPQLPQPQQTTLSKRALLSFIFDGVTKHVRTAFESVLERFVKASAVLGHTLTTSAHPNGGYGEEGEGSELPTVSETGGSGVNKFGLSSQSQQLRAPRGFTGGLTRLLFAATGRRIGGSGATEDGSGSTAAGGRDAGILQRYSNVSSREQQETVMLSLMRGPLSGLHVCYQLLQLFAYYGAATFLPLLGPKASLTVLVSESASVELQRVLQQLVKFISLHLFDSVGGVVSRLQVLRRLSAAFRSSVQVYEAQRSTAPAKAAGGDHEKKPEEGHVHGPATATTSDSPDAKDGQPVNRFVLDFLYKHYSLLMEDTEDTLTSRSDLTSATTAAGGGGAGTGSLGMPVAVGSSGGGFGSSDPQQQASALELARSLQQLILPATPEVTAMLKLLQQLLSDTARQQQMLAAIKEQHRQHRAQLQQQRQQQGDQAEAQQAEEDEKEVDAVEDREDEEQVMCSMVVVQPLLSFPALLSAQKVVSHGLDEPCQLVLELNCFFALRAVLEKNLALLTQASMLRVAAKPEAAAQQQQQQSDGRDAEEKTGTAGSLIDIVDSETARLEAALSDHLAGAAATHYFRHARLPAALRSAVGNGAPQDERASSGMEREESVRHAQKQKAIRTSLYWLYNFYNLIASSGSLPTLPLVPSIAEPAAQTRVHKRVTQQVVEAYGTVYRELEHEREVDAAGALLNAEEAAAFVDMKPEKLNILMDT